ncbi:MAG: hypothetical protein EXS35_18545 [Pedosphaera sp.]|nr:hypothetical protein [Pedosphaera sp.]
MKNQTAWRMLVVVAVTLAGCSNKVDWEMVSKSEFPSPDGRHIATAFEMTCHCTTGHFPQVSVHHAGKNIGDHGNVFAGDAGEGVNVRWISASNLLVEIVYKQASSPLPATTNFDGVTIDFSRR